MSQTAMELLRMETELDFWPTLLNGHRHQVSSTGCPHGQSATMTTTTTSDTSSVPTNNATTCPSSHPSEGHHHHHEKGAKCNEKKTIAGYSRTPHSYYECCINVHVSALLDHWLDWDRPPVSTAVPNVPAAHVPAPNIDELISHLASLADPIPRVREYCNNLGCDVINKPDDQGRTLLHHLLSGKVKTSLPEMCKVLLESGASVDARDHDGNTPLLQIRSLLDAELFEESEAVANILINEHGSNVNAINSKDRTLLSFSVTHADRSVALTRLLLNCGAQVWPDVAQSSHSTIDALVREKDLSAFAWFLKSLMRRDQATLDVAEETLYLLCVEMGEQPSKMRQHVHRTMMQLGKSRSLNGPLFRRIHAEMIPYWARPQDLRYICLKSIRKSLGPKRLSNESATSRLGLPKKLQHYVELREVPAKIDLSTSSSVAVTKPSSFSSRQPTEVQRSFQASYQAYARSMELRDIL